MKNILLVIIWSITLGFLIGYFCPLGRKQKPKATFDNDISWFPAVPIRVINEGMDDAILIITRGTNDGIEIIIQADPNGTTERIDK